MRFWDHSGDEAKPGSLRRGREAQAGEVLWVVEFGQVARAAVTKHCHDCVAGSERTRHLDCAHAVHRGRRAQEEAVVAQQVRRHLDGLAIGTCMHMHAVSAASSRAGKRGNPGLTHEGCMHSATRGGHAQQRNSGRTRTAQVVVDTRSGASRGGQAQRKSGRTRTAVQVAVDTHSGASRGGHAQQRKLGRTRAAAQVGADTRSSASRGGHAQRRKPGWTSTAQVGGGGVDTLGRELPVQAGWRGRQPKLIGWRGRQLKLAGWRGRQLKLAGWQGRQPKLAGWRGRQPKLVGWRGRQPKLAGWQGRQPKLAGWRGRQPKLAGWRGRQLKLAGWQSRPPKLAGWQRRQLKRTCEMYVCGCCPNGQRYALPRGQSPKAWTPPSGVRLSDMGFPPGRDKLPPRLPFLRPWSVPECSAALPSYCVNIHANTAHPHL
eukprot:355983-Chlamydomonas_euryale.AAC.5